MILGPSPADADVLVGSSVIGYLGVNLPADDALIEHVFYDPVRYVHVEHSSISVGVTDLSGHRLGYGGTKRIAVGVPSGV